MGYYILINYKANEEEANNTLALVKEKGVDGEIMQFDVADKEAIMSKLGGWMEANADKVIEVLVNNAGIKEDGLMMWMKDEQWDSVIKTSLDGFLLCNPLVVNSMLQKKYGRIINMVSLSD